MDDNLLWRLLTDEERTIVQLRKGQLIEEASAYCGRYIFLNSAQLGVIPTYATIQHLRSPNQDAGKLQTELMLWTIALDDLLDRRGLSGAETVITLLDCCSAVADTDPHVAGTNEILSSLLEMKTVLQTSPFWPDLRPYWVDMFVRLMTSWAYEAHWSALLRDTTQPAATLPDLDKYLAHGTHSITMPLLFITAMISSYDPCVRDEARNLVDLAIQCGLAMRLANDVATSEREREEVVINGVEIVSRKLSQSSSDRVAGLYEEAKVLLWNRAESEAARARDLAAGIHVASETAERFLRIMELGMAAYRWSDIRQV